MHNYNSITQIPQKPIRLHGSQEPSVACFAGTCAEESVDCGDGGVGEVFEADSRAVDEEFRVGPFAPVYGLLVSHCDFSVCACWVWVWVKVNEYVRTTHPNQQDATIALVRQA
jgi:hypothetical protein